MRFTLKLLAAVGLMAAGVSVMAQDGGGLDLGRRQTGGTVTRRIKIRHADPYLILQLLAGTQTTNLAPETSTVLNVGGNGGFGGGGFGGGRNNGGIRGNNGNNGNSGNNGGHGNSRGGGPRGGF